ncbi:flagellar hook protein FlgE [Haloimpatiens sp. FM7330]|uniref:flagellar hook protein FlgE n=1 Tax=Haloimpatiens sp. FM7330 TaxID=3298610 RepID=UPI003638A9F0
MLRSMYSGISGMKVNQTKLDVVGNNIANVGTTAFKGSRVRFQDMLSQNMAEAIGPGRNQGGSNPRQVGLGVQVAGIDTVMSQGMMQPTGRNLDVGIDGSGYFMVGRGSLPAGNGAGVQVDEASHTITSGNGMQISYSRDGALTLDHQGNLLNSDGYRILGYAISQKDENGNLVGAESIDYNANGVCNFVDVDSENGIKAGSTLVPLRIPEAVHVNASKIADTSGGKEMTFTGIGTVDDITTKPRIHTGGKKFEGEKDLKIEIKFVAEKDATGKITGYKAHNFVNGEQLLDENGKTVDFQTNITKDVLEKHFKGKNGWAKETDATKKDELEKEAQDLAQKLIGGSTITLTEPAVKDGINKANYSWGFVVDADGMKKVTSFSVEKDGVVKATLDDGKVTALGQVATASFRNTAGLKKLGKNLYQNTANSGEPNVRSGIGTDKSIDNSDSYGDMLQGMLEMSNVDLAEQFTDMIVASRAFQASGKMISTGDEILQDIINLKR